MKHKEQSIHPEENEVPTKSLDKVICNITYNVDTETILVEE